MYFGTAIITRLCLQVYLYTKSPNCWVLRNRFRRKVPAAVGHHHDVNTSVGCFTGWELSWRPLCTASTWPRSLLRSSAWRQSPCTPAPLSSPAAPLAPPRPLFRRRGPCEPAHPGCSFGTGCPPSCTLPCPPRSSPPPRPLFSEGGEKQNMSINPQEDEKNLALSVGVDLK